MFCSLIIPPQKACWGLQVPNCVHLFIYRQEPFQAAALANISRELPSTFHNRLLFYPASSHQLSHFFSISIEITGSWSSLLHSGVPSAAQFCTPLAVTLALILWFFPAANSPPPQRPPRRPIPATQHQTISSQKQQKPAEYHGAVMGPRMAYCGMAWPALVEDGKWYVAWRFMPN